MAAVKSVINAPNKACSDGGDSAAFSPVPACPGDRPGRHGAGKHFSLVSPPGQADFESFLLPNRIRARPAAAIPYGDDVAIH
jgi:hypothetical protein